MLVAACVCLGLCIYVYFTKRTVPLIAWVKAPTRNQFFSSYDMRVTVLHDRLFVNDLNGVWASDDGVRWQHLSAKPPFATADRKVFAHWLPHKGLLWGIGGGPGYGVPDVWCSADGKNWRQITANGGFPAHDGKAAVSFADKLWMIGDTSCDAWVMNSSDGATWQKLPMQTPFYTCFDQTLLVFKGELWIINQSDEPSIWHSPDGIRWARVDPCFPRGFQGDGACTVFAGRLWLTGGRRRRGLLETVLRDPLFFLNVQGSDKTEVLNDTWYSGDGSHWTCNSRRGPFEARGGHHCVVFNNRLWLLGGSGPNGPLITGQADTQDYWYSEPVSP